MARILRFGGYLAAFVLTFALIAWNVLPTPRTLTVNPQVSKRTQEFANEVRRISHFVSSLSVCALDPEGGANTTETLDRWEVLGCTDVGSDSHVALLEALAAGFAKYGRQYERLGCSIRPHHAVRFKMVDGQKGALIICYECDTSYVIGPAFPGEGYEPVGTEGLLDDIHNDAGITR